MLRAEFKKAWTKPIIWIAFLFVILSQIIFVSMNYHSGTKELAALYNQFGGKMDEAWKDSVYTRYEEIWGNATPQSVDIYDTTLEQNAILTAYEYTFFTEMLDQYTDSAKKIYGEYGVNAYSNLRTASENGDLVFGSSPAAETMSNQYMVALAFLLFMILFSIDLFSGEKECGIAPIQQVTKHGRKKLLQTKLLVCQISAFLVWSSANISYAIITTLYYGWGNPDSVIQDFQFNACPYNWNTGKYLCIVLLFDFFASQVTSAVSFLLTYFAKHTQKAFALMSGTMILPFLLANFLNITELALWCPCLIHSNWLWSGLRLFQIFDIYIPIWSIAILELILIGSICAILFHHLEKKAETTPLLGES